MDPTYQKFVRRWQEVSDLPVQSLGPLTPLYKLVTKRLKVMPWPVLLLIGVISVLGLYLILGTSVVRITSILQRGF
ncbi:hypothetical protein A2154_02250 [Candidatus Gottesmanbacteria bacterium RBG_16_43_7]|uniref:Uncharacterized protein n=1 Tax=Candidatus Gottesmanbacteria bacterium RBG_16_43_7 TaxID=1798373 RepID=A0A1F5ZBI6_9BACT|nr:MAG: hypothetical protein A2154_02250 [Candidatus Gottesmanbacteria bacterium RBG_16_43_7]